MAASITVSLKLMFCLLSKKVVHCLCIYKKVKKYNFLYSLSRKRYCENVKIGPKEVCTEKVNVHVFVTNKGISETPTELTSCSLRASVTDVLQKLFAAGREGLK